MPDNPNKRGRKNQSRMSEQVHEKKYRKPKTNRYGDRTRQPSHRNQQPNYEQGGRGKG